MNLVEFERRLQEALDERRSPEDDPQLLAAARLSPEHAALLAAFVAVREGAHAWTRWTSDAIARAETQVARRAPGDVLRRESVSESVTADRTLVPDAPLVPDAAAALAADDVLVTRVLADLEQPRGWQMAAWPAAAAVALAASLLAMFAPVWVQQRADQAQLASHDAAAAAQLAPPQVVPPVESRSDAVARGAINGAAEVARQTRDDLSNLALLLPGVGQPLTDGLRSGEAGSDEQSASDLFEQVTSGLQPISQLTGQAFSFLLEALPPVERNPRM